MSLVAKRHRNTNMKRFVSVKSLFSCPELGLLLRSWVHKLLDRSPVKFMVIYSTVDFFLWMRSGSGKKVKNTINEKYVVRLLFASQFSFSLKKLSQSRLRVILLRFAPQKLFLHLENNTFNCGDLCSSTAHYYALSSHINSYYLCSLSAWHSSKI